jgi:ubiquinone/menaquinone biosynthesis C-methylase UbiE
MDIASMRQLVIREFSDAEVQKQYAAMTRQGLWASEQRLIQQYFPAKGRIIDIGCGSGRTSFGLARMGYQVTAVDVTPAMITTALALQKEYRTQIAFCVGDATHLAHQSNAYDGALFSFNGWDQIPASIMRQDALLEACRVIKPGGHLIFTSHIRTWGKYTPVWLSLLFRLYVLRPLKFEVKELEFGDRFFVRAQSGTFAREQFIHIPSHKEIKEQIEATKLSLIYNEYRNAIAPEDSGLSSANCMFFVCRKQFPQSYHSNLGV